MFLTEINSAHALKQIQPNITNQSIMKKFALILALAAVGCASAAITIPTSKAELKSTIAAKKEADKKAMNDKVSAQKAAAAAKKAAAEKAISDAVAEKTTGVTGAVKDAEAKLAEGKAKVDAAKKTTDDIKAAVDSAKSGASTPQVEIEKPSVELNEKGLMIKKPSLKLK